MAISLMLKRHEPILGGHRLKISSAADDKLRYTQEIVLFLPKPTQFGFGIT